MVQATVRSEAMQGWDGLLAANGLSLGVMEQGADEPSAPSTARPCQKHEQCERSTSSLPGTGHEAMPLADFVRFSEGVVTRTRNVAIPWAAGVNYDLTQLGGVGEAVASAGRVGSAIRRFIDYFSLLQDATDVRLDREEGMATVSYRILDPDIWPRHYDAMFTLGIIAQIIQRGAGGAWEKVEFAFEADQSEMRGDIGAVLRAPCSFGADTNQIRFPEAILDFDLPMARRAYDSRPLNRELVERRRETPITERLGQLFFRDLNTLTIDQERIAREIGMSSRTMRRKLADEGSSYQQVLDECRMRQAAFEFRARPNLSIAQIALRLGYAEHSNFTRAFGRWSGMSPQAYRTRLAMDYRSSETRNTYRKPQ